MPYDKWKDASTELDNVCRTRGRCGWNKLQELLLRPCAQPREEFLCLRRTTALLSAHGLGNEARRILESHATGAQWSGSPDRKLLHAAYDAARCALSLRTVDRETVVDPDTVHWKTLEPYTWASNVRLEAAVRAHRHSDVLSALRARNERNRREPIATTPFEQGEQRMILGRHFLLRGHLARSIGYFSAAYRAYSADNSRDTILAAAKASGNIGIVALYQGQLDRGKELITNALRTMNGDGCSPEELPFRIELAWMSARRGEFDEAGEQAIGIVRDLERLDHSDPVRRQFRLSALLGAAHFAVAQGNDNEATSLRDQAERTSSENQSPIIEANLRVITGRIHGLGSSETSYRYALAEFDAARRCYESVGDGFLFGLYKVAIYAGHLHIKHADVEGALREALRCLDFARDRKFLPAASAGLLLKSQLLLQQRGASIVDRLYEDVLRSLHSIHNPRVLFRVIANLYLHSWNRRGDLDLTAHHLEQIHKMKEFLDSSSYDLMYERYVAKPILSRTLAGNFGHTPIEVAE